ncbi:DsbC family protein [Methylomonas fluvii]|uniref:Thiol:disulfide interchange protein n=1 Tax=Methylomonas fluvii TaxID=1854564 RepID=A0ABR9DJA5_9GAMM|nr:DsbC family protein [Methylomonas fluvii]MBD9362319.1 DsbC family protein [Methylomonas fluvii]CAD6875392.1 Thiol:disulfide involved in conjugative transfer [Methylomonas fluvii]
MSLRKFHLLLLAPLLVTSASFAANPPKPAISEIAAGLLSIKIDGMQDLPITGLKMVKTGEQTVFISSNGRFALTGGKLMDIWTQQEIKDLPDIDKIANRIDLSRMKLNVDDLGPVAIGHGKTSVLVFIDPLCPYCGKVMKDLQALQDQYTFKLVMVPILGPESQNIVVQLTCQLGSSDTKLKDSVRDRLLKQDYAGLPTEPPSPCNKEPLQKSVVTAKLFGLQGVPFLIAPDGRTHSGAPDVLADWLANKPHEVAKAITPEASKTEKKP